MKFVDELTLTIHSGKGGDGVVRWDNSRNNPKGGPAGGNGGRGGDVIFRAVRDINLLSKYQGNPEFRAQNGGDGGKQKLHGKNGEDVVINVPRGSIITVTEINPASAVIEKNAVDTREQVKQALTDQEDQKVHVYELLEEGEQVTVLSGGRGGFGNAHFKSSRNVTPRESTKGKMGVSAQAHVELRLIADAGLVGLPSAGKTSLLNTLTNAQGKVGAYAFTTLDPNLGDLFGYIIADIPGIIEGASEGKGLGHTFLRHISRTNTLIFCISVEQDEPMRTLELLRSELEAYDPKLLNARQVILLTKADLVSREELAMLQRQFDGERDVVQAVSIYDEASIKELSDTLVALLGSD